MEDGTATANGELGEKTMNAPIAPMEKVANKNQKKSVLKRIENNIKDLFSPTRIHFSSLQIQSFII